jgi:hypothetical protein
MGPGIVFKYGRVVQDLYVSDIVVRPYCLPKRIIRTFAAIAYFVTTIYEKKYSLFSLFGNNKFVFL